MSKKSPQRKVSILDTKNSEKKKSFYSVKKFWLEYFTYPRNRGYMGHKRALKGNNKGVLPIFLIHGGNQTKKKL